MRIIGSLTLSVLIVVVALSSMTYAGAACCGTGNDQTIENLFLRGPQAGGPMPVPPNAVQTVNRRPIGPAAAQRVPDWNNASAAARGFAAAPVGAYRGPQGPGCCPPAAPACGCTGCGSVGQPTRSAAPTPVPSCCPARADRVPAARQAAAPSCCPAGGEKVSAAPTAPVPSCCPPGVGNAPGGAPSPTMNRSGAGTSIPLRSVTKPVGMFAGTLTAQRPDRSRSHAKGPVAGTFSQLW
jgi:hypothetical protein